MPIIIIPDPFNLSPPTIIHVEDRGPEILGAMIGVVALVGLILVAFFT